MPIKDIMHVYECKFCKKRFTMFTKPDGELVHFPDNATWPTHGEFELVSHLKNEHRYNYNLDVEIVGYDPKYLINMNYHMVE